MPVPASRAVGQRIETRGQQVTQAAYKEAMVREASELASTLQDALGQKLVAYATGVRSPRLVGRWAAGTTPRDAADARLRLLYRVWLTLHEQHSDRTIRAFLLGSNPDLGDRAPIDVIRDDHGAQAVHAAEAFLA